MQRNILFIILISFFLISSCTKNDYKYLVATICLDSIKLEKFRRGIEEISVAHGLLYLEDKTITSNSADAIYANNIDRPNESLDFVYKLDKDVFLNFSNLGLTQGEYHVSLLYVEDEKEALQYYEDILNYLKKTDAKLYFENKAVLLGTICT